MLQGKLLGGAHVVTEVPWPTSWWEALERRTGVRLDVTARRVMQAAMDYRRTPSHHADATARGWAAWDEKHADDWSHTPRARRAEFQGQRASWVMVDEALMFGIRKPGGFTAGPVG